MKNAVQDSHPDSEDDGLFDRKNRRRKSALQQMGRVLCLLGWVVLAVACTIPGRLYPVAPATSGRVHGGELQTDGARLTLHVVYSESADLYVRKQVPLTSDGLFAFETPELAVAGHEYGKTYRVLLQFSSGELNRVIWRAHYSRLALTGQSLVLDCDLDRPAQHGQPCWVNDPLEYPWLAAQGESTFRRLCMGCHGIDGSGFVGVAEPSVTPRPDLRLIAARRGGRFDRAEIAEWIDGRAMPDAHDAGGARGGMPVWGEELSVEYERYSDPEALVGATLDPLVTYLESLQRTE
jgi:hypothetical protein